jgi:hypothetical protein
MILNIAPDGTGAVPSTDVTRYSEMGTALKCLFSKPVAQSDAPMRMNAGSGVVEPAVEFPPVAAAAAVNLSVVLREDQTTGQLIGNYSLECRTSSGWSPCPPGTLSDTISKCQPQENGVCGYTGVGHKRILVVGALLDGLSGVRVVVHSHFAVGAQTPTLRDLSIFDWSGSIESCV